MSSISGANAWTSCPANSAPSGSGDANPRISRADGLAGQLGLYHVEVNGEIRYMTRDEAERCASGNAPSSDGNGSVAYTSNYRELLRESVNDVQERSLTDEALTKTARDVLQPGSPFAGPSASNDARLRADFEARANMLGRTTVFLEGFKPPGWEAATGPADCYKLACQGAKATAGSGESVTGGGGVILYEAAARRIKTDADASRLALDQIKAHVDSGRAVVAGVNEPGTNSVVDKVRQPVTDHFVAIYGYEVDHGGKITALLAKDNAIAGAADIRFVVKPDGSIVKPAEARPNGQEYLKQEYQLSEVRFHSSMSYTGPLTPTNDAGKKMVW